MSWQKCPICHGTGKDVEEIAARSISRIASKLKAMGHKFICEV